MLVDKQEVYAKVKTTLVDLFELDANEISLTTKLYDDLDLDSIDAVDLVVSLQNQTGKKIKPDDFRTVRTVEDIVNAVVKLLQE